MLFALLDARKRHQLTVRLTTEANAERDRLAATIAAAQDNAGVQQAAVERLSADLGERLLEQQERAFATTAEALERRAVAEGAALRQAYEATATERVDRVQSELLPIRELLQQMHACVGEVRESRAADAAALTTMVQRVTEEQTAHRRDTAKLSQLLRSSTVRGQYGELTLQRTLEHAGLIDHVHYVAQVSARDDAGLYRPDALVLLPGNRCLVIDSKAPLQHLLDAQQATDKGERDQLIGRHAKSLRTHVDQLASKDYDTRLAASGVVTEGRQVLDGVLLFLPSPVVLDVALQRDPDLLSHAFSQRVFLTTPTTLLLALHTVAQLWRHERLSSEADEILRIGTAFYERLGVVIRHVAKLQGALTASVTAFDGLTSSLESRVLPAARRLSELGLRTSTSLPAVQQVGAPPRALGLRLETLAESARAATVGADAARAATVGADAARAVEDAAPVTPDQPDTTARAA